MSDDEVQAVLPLVYDELRGLARRMQQERHGDLNATSVVHEAFLRLSGNEHLQWRSRAHFRAIAAKAMRCVLADRARRRHAAKRGGDWERVTLAGVGASSDPVDALALNRALDALTEVDPDLASLVEMRFLAGMTVAEVSEITGRSRRSVERDWRVARAWLVDALR